VNDFDVLNSIRDKGVDAAGWYCVEDAPTCFRSNNFYQIFCMCRLTMDTLIKEPFKTIFSARCNNFCSVPGLCLEGTTLRRKLEDGSYEGDIQPEQHFPSPLPIKTTNSNMPILGEDSTTTTTKEDNDNLIIDNNSQNDYYQSLTDTRRSLSGCCFGFRDFGKLRVSKYSKIFAFSPCKTAL